MLSYAERQDLLVHFPDRVIADKSYAANSMIRHPSR
jgi:hypothetical protein